VNLAWLTSQFSRNTSNSWLLRKEP